MPPQLTDGDGHDLRKLGYADAQFLWQLARLTEVSAAHAEGRKVSFKVPSIHDEGAST
jgi:hypothetical protein